MDLTQVILKGLGKAKVKSILHQWIKDQVNRSLENKYEIRLDPVIYLNEYSFSMYKIDLGDAEPFEVDDLFQFIGNKI